MAKLGLNLSETVVNKSTGSNETGFTIVPTGRYSVVVGSAEVRDTKSGSALVLGYKIVNGEHEGSLIKDFLNIVNPSEKAQRISLERLATVSWCTDAKMKNGVLEDTTDLLDCSPFDILVEQVEDGEYKNMKIKSVLCTRSLDTVKPVTEKVAPTRSWNKK
jgi:hypothetical protein